MGVPRLSDSKEIKRQEVVDELGGRRVQKDPALDRVAEAIAVICDVDSAHVSLMEDETQCVVGEVGMDEETFDRENTFCAHTIAHNEVFIVEDAAEDDRFANSPHVATESGIRFYLGLPIVIDGVPVGTVCALASDPRSIELDRRSELFGAVHAVEAHLRVRHQHGADSFEFDLSQKVTAARASATAARFTSDLKETCEEHILELERELRDCIGLLDIDEPETASRLGYAETDVDEERGDS